MYFLKDFLYIKTGEQLLVDWLYMNPLEQLYIKPGGGALHQALGRSRFPLSSVTLSMRSSFIISLREEQLLVRGEF